MNLTRLDSTSCCCHVKSACIAEQTMPVLGDQPPSSTPRDSAPPCGNLGPRVVFIPCRFGDSWRFKSSGEFIRISVSSKRGLKRFDADWFSTDLELAPHAAAAIQSRWTAELGFYPKRRRGADCGGLKSCLILDVNPEREMHWRRFLRRLLSDPLSWRSVKDFCLAPLSELDTLSGSQP
jgi:hypothetical protein